jgi:hypothetical protein
MHVYLRDEPVQLRMEKVDTEGLVPADTDLTAIAFYVRDNETPSFRALLPDDTIEVLREALVEPVTLGVLAEEPENPDSEIQAMVGLAVPVGELDAEQEGGGDEPEEPWKASAGDPDAWRGEDPEEAGDPEMPRTALLAFAPLVRIRRRFPLDFGDELADLLETALAGVTRPALEARVDRMLGDL